MKVRSCLFALLLALASVSGLNAAVGDPPAAGGLSDPAGPSIQLAETSHDFGEVYDGKEYVHNFMVKNTGNAPLEIKKVLPG